jgi:hypothetical protein
MAIPDWIKKTVRENYARVSEAGRRATLTEPRAARATYRARENALQIELTNGVVLRVPVKLIPYLKGVSTREIRAVEVLGCGDGLHWESLDLDLSVPALVASVFESPEWMSELGRIGGRQSSAAKAAAARRNGRKGGRPRTRPARGAGARGELAERVTPVAALSAAAPRRR